MNSLFPIFLSHFFTRRAWGLLVDSATHQYLRQQLSLYLQKAKEARTLKCGLSGPGWVCRCSLEELTQAFTSFPLTSPPMRTISCPAWLRRSPPSPGGAEVLSCSDGVLDSVVGSQLRGMGSSLGRYNLPNDLWLKQPNLPHSWTQPDNNI